MSSVSKKQANMMSAIKHGWHPPAGMHAPSKKVATEFHEADKKVGKYEHAYAEGGPVDSNITQRGLDLISHAADRATSWLASDPHSSAPRYTDPHHIAARFVAGLGSQVLGTDEKGRPQLGRMPGIVKEALAIPAGVTDIGEGLARLGAGAGDALNAQGHDGPPGLGALQAARSLLDRLHGRYGADLAPGWSREADRGAGETHQAVRAAMGLAAPRGTAENIAEAGGAMVGQLPIGAARGTESTLAKLLKSPMEYLGPTVRPSVANYGAGTLAGGIMGAGGDGPAPPQGLQGHAEGGKVDVLRRGILKGLAGLTAAGAIGGEKVLQKAGHAITEAQIPKMTEEHLAAPAAMQHIAPAHVISSADDLRGALGHMDLENEGYHANTDHALAILKDSPARAHPLVKAAVEGMESNTSKGARFSQIQNLDRALLDISPEHHAALHDGTAGGWYDSPAHQGATVRHAGGGEMGPFFGAEDNQVWYLDNSGRERWMYAHEAAPPDPKELTAPSEEHELP